MLCVSSHPDCFHVTTLGGWGERAFWPRSANPKKYTLSYIASSRPRFQRKLLNYARNQPSPAYMSSSVRSSPTPKIRSNPSASSCNIVRSALPLLMREGWMTMYFFRGAITTRTCSFYQTCRIRALRNNGGSLLWARSSQLRARYSQRKTLAMGCKSLAVDVST